MSEEEFTGEDYDIQGEESVDPFYEDEVALREEPEEEKDEDEDEIEENSIPTQPEVKRLVTGAERRSRNVMTRFEFARLIETYAEILAHNAPMDPRVPSDSDDDIELARASLVYREPGIKFPLTVEQNATFTGYRFPLELRRPMDDGSIEVWHIEELILPTELPDYGLTIE